jgi:hypothetical protein
MEHECGLSHLIFCPAGDCVRLMNSVTSGLY